MPILLQEDLNKELPKMYKVKQIFSAERLENISENVLSQLDKPEIKGKIKSGQKVAVAVGSRGIKNLFEIVKCTIEQIKLMGAEPFIVSAMGSHGGATEKGQAEVLAGYGITKEALGVEIITSLDTVNLGTTPKGIDVHFDTAAYNSDAIVIINRVKLHTDFVGKLQSGLCKMMVIGLGNHKGCSAIHEEDPEDFAEIIEQASNIIMEKAPITFGVAIMENAYDDTMLIEAIPVEKINEREKELVKLVVENMPFIRISEADVLVCSEIGKDISGAGFDPNILGRSPLLKAERLHIPKFQKMVLTDITEVSHGNGIGVGLFDVITQKVADNLSHEDMYANAIACKSIDDVKIPLTVPDEEYAIRVALKVCKNINKDNPKIIKIPNTLHLEYIEVSEALLEEVRLNENLILV